MNKGALHCNSVLLESGDPIPSIKDKRVTQRPYQASKLLRINLLDHVVIGDNK